MFSNTMKVISYLQYPGIAQGGTILFSFLLIEKKIAIMIYFRYYE